MKKCLLLLGLLCSIYSSAQQHQWVMPLGGDWFDFGHAVFADDSGYVYSTGQFSTRSDFDPRTNRLANISSNGFYDVYVHKADSSGQLVWAKGFGGNLQDSGEDIVVDDSGNVYTVGYFLNTVDFDPSNGVFNMSSNGVQDLFVQKLNRNGDFVWAISIGGSGGDFAHNVLLDNSNNIIISGSFTGTVDFDPDTSVYTISGGANPDAFILKLSNSGQLIWVKTIDGINIQSALSSAIDTFGNIYSTGHFKGTTDFDPGTSVYNLTANNNEDVYVQKLDPMGNFLWAKAIGGLGNERGESISVSAFGSPVITGHFSNRIDLNPDTNITVSSQSAGDVDLFIVRLDPNGNYIWGTTMGSTSRDRGESVVQDSYSNIYVIGQYGFTVDFDPRASTANMTSTGSADIFVLKLDASGNFNWVQSVGSFNIDVGKGIAIDSKDNIYTTGYFESQVDFDPGTNTDTRLSAGWNDIFVQKFGQLNNSVNLYNIPPEEPKIFAYPNPTKDVVKIELPRPIENVDLEIRDLTGKLVYKKHFLILQSKDISIDQPMGTYFILLKSVQHNSLIKLVKE